MPSTYAHYRMGQEVIKQLSDPVREIIMENKELYDIGLHGPDILFYYHPLKVDPVNSIGYRLHEHSGKFFFERAAKVIENSSRKKEELAYIFGFICHFALDSTCHGYIDEKIAKSGISHAEIEVEFDRSLMEEDGLDPIRHELTKHIVPSIKNAQVIAAFFPETSPKQIETALEGMIKYNHLLLAPSKLKRMKPDYEVVVYEKTDIVSFGACGLPYYVGGFFNDSNMMIAREKSKFIESGIDLNTFKEVIDIDSSQKKLTIKDTLTNEIFTDNYDKLMIATGASSIMPPLEKSYNNLTTLKDMNDGIKLRELMNKEENKNIVNEITKKE